jgi:hypothetical protein
MKTLQECLFELRAAAGGAYVCIEMTANLYARDSEPTVTWTAWRGDLQMSYHDYDYQEVARRAINDIR